MFLRELKQSLTGLKGVGPRMASALSSMGIHCVGDLLLLAPRDYDDRRRPTPLADFARAPKVNTVVTVVAHDWFGFGRMRTLKVWVEDESSKAALLCFNRPFLEKQLPVGGRFRLSGAFQYRYGEIQSSSFEVEPLEADAAADGHGADGAGSPSAQAAAVGIVPVYPLTAGVNQAAMRKAVWRALSEYGRRVEDEVPDPIRERRSLMGMAAALEALHRPTDENQLASARRTLAYQELFQLQLLVGERALQRKASFRGAPPPVDPSRGSLKRALIDRLPFALTADQLSAVAEIEADLSGPVPMARLLQGDVGSGKTLVAFMACLAVIERGGQAALMAPTELLARQHADTAARLLEPLGVRLAFLSGNLRESGRKSLLAELESGRIDLVIGTHALFSEGVRYRRLRLAVIDEQHRFGVAQRLALGAKERECDILMMSATPIPRSLALTAYGDLDLSTIRSMPAGRKPVKTHLALQGNVKKVHDFVRGELEAGRQAYFVYPLIESSDKVDLKDAQSEFERLSQKVFPGFRVGLIHSRLPEEEKRSIMASFSAGETKILVATSVVEVGVDVPNATCIVVEHAERFGLAALHQLRGRVGRGIHQSYAFLVYAKDPGPDAVARLKAMMESTDGFLIAEEDLRIRGPGEISGTAQSGQLRLLFADLVRDAELLAQARSDAQAVLASDPLFARAEHDVLARLRELSPRAITTT